MKFIEPKSQSLNYDTNAESDKSAIHCEDPTLTQQQFVEESDINYIAERYGLTGEMPQVLDLPHYGDFSEIFDFQTAQNQVIEAKRQFMTLPAKIRARFRNSPQELLEFLADTDNKDEAIALGLVNKPQAPLQSTSDTPPTPAPAAPPGAAPAASGGPA